mgnify:CR=1 FL=1
MTKYGLMLSSEEHTPRDLVDLAVRAEDAGFDYIAISDHYHPWTSQQGHSPFVWSILGGIASSTDTIGVGTAVTCPTIRMHPAIVAQASATAAAMMPGRFFLGLGSGENLNEHITGEPWPAPASRVAMLEEAIDIIRELWTGDEVSHEGAFYTVNRATLFTLPPEPPPIMIAAASPVSIRLAAANDGLITTESEREMIETFEEAGGKGKPRYVQVGFCWDPDPEEALKIVHRQWPISAMPWSIKTDLATPDGFEAVAELVRKDDIAQAVPTGNDFGMVRKAIDEATSAGFDHVTLHQIGPRVGEFIDRFANELAPSL